MQYACSRQGNTLDVNYLIVPERGRAGRVNHGNRKKEYVNNANGNHRSRENCV
jgi:hypothetical protein